MGGRVTFLAFRARAAIVVILGIVGLVLAGVMAFHVARPVTTSVTERVAGRTVVIDPGHGGVDPGAIGPGGILEKDITLAVALELEKLLNRAAIHTIMTRTGDYDLADADATLRKSQDLARRVEIGRNGTADVFISLHANSFPNPNYSGAQTFYFPNREQDRMLAEKIQSSLVRRLGPNRRLANSADYYVLRESTVPAVVVELGFLSHPSEGERLADADYQKRLAEAIYYGIIDYFVQHTAIETAVAPSGDVNPIPPTHVSLTSDLNADEVLLFFPSLTEDDPNGTAAVVRQLPSDIVQRDVATVADATLRALLKGPPPEAALVRIIPPDVDIRNVSFERGILTVDFNRALRDSFQGGAREERLLLESIVRTLGQFDGVDQVQILIEGESNTSVGGHVLLAQPFPVRREGRP